MAPAVPRAVAFDAPLVLEELNDNMETEAREVLFGDFVFEYIMDNYCRSVEWIDAGYLLMVLVWLIIVFVTARFFPKWVSIPMIMTYYIYNLYYGKGLMLGLVLGIEIINAFRIGGASNQNLTTAPYQARIQEAEGRSEWRFNPLLRH